MVSEVEDDLDDLEQVIFLGTPEWDALMEPSEEGMDEVLASRAATLHHDDAINIQYTSGTTGFPKGATLSHSNILNNAFFVGESCAYTEEDRVCIPVPLYHCFGMVLGTLACTTHGSAIVLPGLGFNPEEVLTAVQEERCTSLYGVPTMFIAELAHPDLQSFDLSSLRTGIMAGSPCPVEVMKQVLNEMNMTDVTIAYGMTETSPVSTQTMTTDTIDRRVSTVGRVHPHVEIKIIDPESGETVERGRDGELCTRGYSVMLGYWNDPAADHRIDRRGGVDAFRGPGHDGLGRLYEHRRADQGHDHPRRREHLPQGDRGVPLRASGHRGRAGHRRPRPQVRRAGHGLGQAARRQRRDRRGHQATSAGAA